MSWRNVIVRTKYCWGHNSQAYYSSLYIELQCIYCRLLVERFMCTSKVLGDVHTQYFYFSPLYSYVLTAAQLSLLYSCSSQTLNTQLSCINFARPFTHTPIQIVCMHKDRPTGANMPNLVSYLFNILQALFKVSGRFLSDRSFDTLLTDKPFKNNKLWYNKPCELYS